MNLLRMHIDPSSGMGPIVTLTLVLSGYIFGGDATVLLQQVTTVSVDLGFPEWAKDTFQCFAWAGAGVAGFATGHGWWVKYVTPRLNKRKSRKK